MDDKGLNEWLRVTYGTTLEGLPLFKLVWSTNLRESRRSTFTDFYGDIIIREVTETRLCLKYPMAQNRWVIEKIYPTPASVLGKELFLPYTYEGIYIFQTHDGKRLELERDKLEMAVWAFLQYGRIKQKDRIDIRMELLARREAEKKEKIRQIIGQEMRSPYFFVLE